MQAAEQPGAVTPEGVRNGDPAALAALVERRGAAVLAYSREVCAPADAPIAAAEALARFRAAVHASGDATDLDPERLLLSATRHASAARARPPVEAGGARRILGRGYTETCAHMPALIVARAENLLGEADLDRLSRHLDRCSTCRATEAAFRRAERAYVATTHAPLDGATTVLFLAALADAAPVEGEAAPAEAAAEVEAAAAPVTEQPERVPVFEEPVVEEQLVEAEPDEYDHTDDEGWTGEQEEVAGDTYDHPMIEPGPATWNATEEPPRRHRRLRILIPTAILAVGAAAALAVAGVFGSSGGSSPSDTRTVQSTSVAPPKTATKHKTKRKQSTNPTTVTATP
jgi:hypothetical protein